MQELWQTKEQWVCDARNCTEHTADPAAIPQSGTSLSELHGQHAGQHAHAEAATAPSQVSSAINAQKVRVPTVLGDAGFSEFNHGMARTTTSHSASALCSLFSNRDVRATQDVLLSSADLHAETIHPFSGKEARSRRCSLLC